MVYIAVGPRSTTQGSCTLHAFLKGSSPSLQPYDTSHRVCEPYTLLLSAQCLHAEVFEAEPTRETQMLSGMALLVLAQLACRGAVRDMIAPEISLKDLIFEYAQTTSDLYNSDPLQWARRYVKKSETLLGACTPGLIATSPGTISKCIDSLFCVWYSSMLGKAVGLLSRMSSEGTTNKMCKNFA